MNLDTDRARSISREDVVVLLLLFLLEVDTVWVVFEIRFWNGYLISLMMPMNPAVLVPTPAIGFTAEGT